MEGMKCGYARISTEDQNAAMQHTALKRAGCKTHFTDELSGAITKRLALLRCMKKLERGDTLGLDPRVCGSSTGWAAACTTS
jgi:DNA invertase Pin-like site-specific DNA recombinase